MQDILIDAKMADQIIENEFANSDPFNKGWEELIGLNGINKNFKRKVSRVEKANTVINNVPRQADGQISSQYLKDSKAVGQSVNQQAGSKKINPGQVYRNGYGIFDLIKDLFAKLEQLDLTFVGWVTWILKYQDVDNVAKATFLITSNILIGF